MGSLYHPEAALFCLFWVIIAVCGFVLEGWIAGAALSMGFMAVLMPTTAIIVSKTNDFELERTVRWSLLIVAGAILALVHTIWG